MRIRGLWHYSRLLLLAGLLAVAAAPAALAVTSNSDHYQLSESQFGSSSNQENCSDQYCARATIGDMAVGDAAGNTVKGTFGPITPEEPALEVIVEPGVSHLGVLSTETTATKTAVVKVRSYLSGGYTLLITGSPPKYANHTLATPSTPTASAAGTEQFGINAVANTSPITFGAAPVQVPSSQFSFGEAAVGYATSNLFKYASGDVVARSLTESGQTEYTLSMIINIANNTPAGHYVGDFSAVVIPIY